MTKLAPPQTSLRTRACVLAALAVGCIKPVPEVADAGLSVPPDAGVVECNGFFWSGSTVAGRNANGQLAAKSLSVFGDGWFEMVLSSGERLRGVKQGTSATKDAGAPAGLIVILPDSQRGVHFGVGGIASGCTLDRRVRAMSGPFQATTLDASTGWDFEVVSKSGTPLLSF